MINLIIFGPPGSGKGTQAAKLVKKYKLQHISTGDLFRYNLSNETKLGKEAKMYIDKGELVPDKVTIKMLKDKVESSGKVSGFILDGFPRTIAQSKALDKFLKSKGETVSKLIMLDVPDQELKQRLLERGKTSGRSDDMDPKIIQNRIDVYKENTFPVFDYYFDDRKAVKVWGVGSLETVFKRLCLEINELEEVKKMKKLAAAKRARARKAAEKKKASKTTKKKTTNSKKTTAKRKAAPKKRATTKRSATAKKSTARKTTAKRKTAPRKKTSASKKSKA